MHLHIKQLYCYYFNKFEINSVLYWKNKKLRKDKSRLWIIMDIRKN
jgi:hypothetical protein